MKEMNHAVNNPSSPPNASDPPVVRFRRNPWIGLAKGLGSVAMVYVAAWPYLATDDIAVATVWLLGAINILADGWWHHVTPLVEIREGKMIVHHHYLRAVDRLMLSDLTKVDTHRKELLIFAKPRRTPIRVRLDRAAIPDLLIGFLNRYRIQDSSQD